MSIKRPLSEVEIGEKLKAGKRFSVQTVKERKAILMGAKFLGVQVTTKSDGYGGFDVFFIKN